MEVYDTKHGYIGKKIAEFKQDEESDSLYYVLSDDPMNIRIRGFPFRKLTRLSNQDLVDIFQRQLSGSLRFYDEEILGSIDEVYSIGFGEYGWRVDESIYDNEPIGIFSRTIKQEKFWANSLEVRLLSEVKPVDRKILEYDRKRALQTILDRFAYLGVDVFRERKELGL
jgi:hypothetical protein